VLSPILNRQAGDPDGAPATEFTLDLHLSETTYAIRAYAAAGLRRGRQQIGGLRDTRQLRGIQDFAGSAIVCIRASGLAADHFLTRRVLRPSGRGG
jgi:hypothetical protein